MKTANLSLFAVMCGLCVSGATLLVGAEPVQHFEPDAKPFPKKKPVAAPVPQSSTVLYNNFGPGNSYNTSASWIVGGYDVDNDQINDGYQDVACPFVVTGSGDVYLEQVDVAPAICSGQNAMNIALYDDNNGEPGQVLEFWVVNGILGPCGDPNPAVTLLSSGTKLKFTEQYWIVLSHPAQTAATGIWSFNNQNDNGTVAFRQNNGPWGSGPNIRSAMRITANTSAPCPVTSAIRSATPDELDGYIPTLTLTEAVESKNLAEMWRTKSLDNVRGFRDEILHQTTDGRKLIDLYYAHSVEVNAILAKQPEMRQQVRSLLLSALPAITKSRSTGSVRVSSSDFRKAIALLDACEKAASPELRNALSQVRDHLTSSARTSGDDLLISFRMPHQQRDLFWGVSFTVLAIGSVIMIRRQKRACK